MITQSLHFEVTGQDAQRLLLACKQKNIEPIQAFELFLEQFTQQYQIHADDELRAKKLAYAGVLSHLSNPKLMALEEKAVEIAIKEKYSVD